MFHPFAPPPHLPHLFIRRKLEKIDVDDSGQMIIERLSHPVEKRLFISEVISKRERLPPIELLGLPRSRYPVTM